MLLPHGYEGQGPEHSSARLERFLQLCAEENWIVANCSTPANYFHILRRQIHRKFRKPLVLLTPKSLLRNRLATSEKKDFLNNSSFHRILRDDNDYCNNNDFSLTEDNKIKKVIICSGKIYYDLLEKRNSSKLKNIYLLRIEQFYPFPARPLKSELSRFPNAKIIWCQEEPKNQGAWFFIEPNIEWVLNKISFKNKRACYVGRSSAASPATGLAKEHNKQQIKLINEALEL